MAIHFIDFVSPTGIEGSFNTFRLGLFYSKRLQKGDTVYLVDNKEKLVLGKALVIGVFLGPLQEMIQAHAVSNHAMLSYTQGHAEKLAELLGRFYGPHIATPNKKTTVLYLRRVNGIPENPH